jgi:protein-L-isoaspartate(D-aspartate) O-methyltransferase
MNNKKINILVQEIESMGVTDKKVLEAVKNVKREDFIIEEEKDHAYGNYPLPIGCGQTISQPYTVAFMIEQLELEKGERVLEIGAGSGYNAAIMGKIIGATGKIYSIERISELVEFAKKNLEKSGIKNVEVIHGDGYKGYEKESPYNKIIVTAACPEIPKGLKEQLKFDGILVAPVDSFYGQDMIKLTKTKHGFKKKKLGTFSFVPLVKGKK